MKFDETNRAHVKALVEVLTEFSVFLERTNLGHIVQALESQIEAKLDDPTHRVEFKDNFGETVCLGPKPSGGRHENRK